MTADLPVTLGVGLAGCALSGDTDGVSRAITLIEHLTLTSQPGAYQSATRACMAWLDTVAPILTPTDMARASATIRDALTRHTHQQQQKEAP